MKSYEALQLAISGKTLEVAKRLGLSTSLINKWQEPSTDYTDSGAYNPLDRIEAIVEFALSKGHKEALAPIHYLNNRFGLVALPVSHPRCEKREINRQLSKLLKEFSELVDEYSKAIEDGVITKLEASKIDTEAWRLIREIAVFNEIIQDAAK